MAVQGALVRARACRYPHHVSPRLHQACPERAPSATVWFDRRGLPLVQHHPPSMILSLPLLVNLSFTCRARCSQFQAPNPLLCLDKPHAADASSLLRILLEPQQQGWRLDRRAVTLGDDHPLDCQQQSVARQRLHSSSTDVLVLLVNAHQTAMRHHRSLTAHPSLSFATLWPTRNTTSNRELRGL